MSIRLVFLVAPLLLQKSLYDICFCHKITLNANSMLEMVLNTDYETVEQSGGPSTFKKLA